MWHGGLQTQNPAISAYLPQVLQLVLSVIGEDDLVSEAVQAELKSTIRWLLQTFQTAMAPVVGALSPELQQKIATL
jgi:hypothetical protein